MAFNLGNIFVTIKAKSEELDKGLKGAQSKLEGFNQKVANGFKKAERGSSVILGSLAGITTLIAGLTIKGGISRALNIEDAKAKLRGLGHDTRSVERIMDSALKSVKGTAYGLDAAATTAANAVAAGIKPGDELTVVLKTVANSAALAGRDMSEMGSIFNKVATANKVQMDVINQLHDAGIPALQFLADEMGVTAEAAAEMASDGKINFETFERAMRKGVGNAADEMGKTTRGAWSNMLASMSRTGEKIVENIIPSIRDAFGSVTEWFDENGEKIAEVFEGLAEKAGMLLEKFNEFEGKDKILAAIGGAILFSMVPAITALAVSLWGLVAPLLPFMAIGAAVGFLAKVIIDNWDGISGFFSNLWNKVTGFASKFFDWIWDKITWFKDNWAEAIGFVIGFFATLPIKLPIFVYKAIQKIIDWVKGIDWGKVFSAIGRAFGAVWDGVKDAGKKALNFLKNIKWGDMLKSIGKGIANAIIGLIEGAINGATSGIPGFPKLNLPRFAAGTHFAPGGAAIMNEFGPETAILPRGTKVLTADETRRNESSGNTYNIHIKGALARSESEMADIIIAGVKAADRRLRAAGKPQIMGGTV